jgi:hypothetical protein
MKANVQLTPIMICSEKVSIAASIPLKWKGKGFALDETEHFQTRQVNKSRRYPLSIREDLLVK